jgi:hypothetical protein
MIRQPPAAVPTAIVTAQTPITHLGNTKTGVLRKSNQAARTVIRPHGSAWLA